MTMKNLYMKYDDFYPRPPGGGRPQSQYLTMEFTTNFYPRPPGGGRHKDLIRAKLEQIISIHALRVEGDTIAQGQFIGTQGISIHALRVEGDDKL